LNPEVFCELLELARGEIAAVSDDDAMWHTVSACDGLEELDDHCRLLVCYRRCFNPLGEFVDCDEEISMAAAR
jgi:hypothetical protein